MGSVKRINTITVEICKWTSKENVHNFLETYSYIFIYLLYKLFLIIVNLNTAVNKDSFMLNLCNINNRLGIFKLCFRIHDVLINFTFKLQENIKKKKTFFIP